MVYMLLGTGFEETEMIAPLDLMRRADIEVYTVGVGSKVVTGSHGIPVVADVIDIVAHNGLGAPYWDQYAK